MSPLPRRKKMKRGCSNSKKPESSSLCSLLAQRKGRGRWQVTDLRFPLSQFTNKKKRLDQPDSVGALCEEGDGVETKGGRAIDTRKAPQAQVKLLRGSHVSGGERSGRLIFVCGDCCWSSQSYLFLEASHSSKSSLDCSRHSRGPVCLYFAATHNGEHGLLGLFRRFPNKNSIRSKKITSAALWFESPFARDDDAISAICDSVINVDGSFCSPNAPTERHFSDRPSKSRGRVK